MAAEGGSWASSRERMAKKPLWRFTMGALSVCLREELTNAKPLNSSRTRLHPHRAACRHSHYCHFGCNPLSGVRSGAREGAPDRLPLELAAGGPGDPDVCAGL